MLLYGKTYARNTPRLHEGDFGAHRVHIGLAGEFCIDSTEGSSALHDGFAGIAKDDHGIFGVVRPALSTNYPAHGLSPNQIIILHVAVRPQECRTTENGAGHLVTLFLVEIHAYAMHPDELLSAQKLLVLGGFGEPLVDVVDVATLARVRKELFHLTDLAVIENGELEVCRQAVETFRDVATAKRGGVGDAVLFDEINDFLGFLALVDVHALKI